VQNGTAYGRIYLQQRKEERGMSNKTEDIRYLVCVGLNSGYDVYQVVPDPDAMNSYGRWIWKGSRNDREAAERLKKVLESGGE
jgi:hypothetical protein